MLSDDAMTLAWALRRHVGADKKGVGPDVSQLRMLTDLSDERLRQAVLELERIGFVRVNRGHGAPLGGIVSVYALESMQAYLDELEGQ